MDWWKFGFPNTTAGMNHLASSSTTKLAQSMDYLKAINLKSFYTSPSSDSRVGATTTSNSDGNNNSSIYDMVLGSISPSQLLLENQIVTSITTQLEAKWNAYLTNTLQATTMGIWVGAILGAAVATGVMIGMVAVMGAAANSSAYSKMARQWQNAMTRTYLNLMGHNKRGAVDTSKGTAAQDEQSDEKEKMKLQPDDGAPTADNVSSTGSTTAMTSATSVSSHGPLVILQGNPDNTSKNSTDQCQSCLDSIHADLQTRYGMSWKHVRRLTAYIVAGRCEAHAFRRVLQEYTARATADADAADAITALPLVSILFVQQLEDENALVQVEAIATTSLQFY